MLIIVLAVTAVLIYFAAHAIGQVIALQNNESLSGALAVAGLSGVDTSGWQIYRDTISGFSIQYPPGWKIYTGGLSASTPFIELGNPLSGMTTYVMEVFVENNSSSLSSGEYVHQLLSADRAQDATNAKNSPAPSVTPQFQSNYLTTVNGNSAYELFDVFEFDHNAEQIYVTHGAFALRFDFPIADVNPNIASPANNNAIAHMIMGTLEFE